MSTVEKLSVALTAEQAAAVRAAVETGAYASSSEVIREALREWQLQKETRHEHAAWLREQWELGKKSGEARPLDMDKALVEARRRLDNARKAIRDAS